jgi:hypothetical protein
MATYVNNLRLKEIVTGAESGTWGTSTNTNLELIADAFGSGTEAITTNADTHSTTVADGAADEGRAIYMKYTGTLDSACTISLLPNTINKFWIIENATSGSQNIIISQGSGANITIGNGKVAAIFTDGAGSGAAVLDAFADLELSATLTVAGASTLTGVTTHGGNVVSDADSTDDLGTTGVRWANLWVDAITMGGTLAGAVGTFSSTLGVTGTSAFTGNVGINTAAGTPSLAIGGSKTSSSSSDNDAIFALDQTLTGASAQTNKLNGLYVNCSFVTGAGITSINAVGINTPSITETGGAVTNASTLFIEGAPSAATNNYALHVAGGATKLGGTLTVNDDVTMASTKKLYLDGGGDTYLGEQSADDFHIIVGDAELLRLVGNTVRVPGAYANTTGSAVNMRVSSAGDLARSTSSLRYKTDVVDYELERAQSLIAALSPISYRHKEEDHHHLGFTAEAVYPLEPLLVVLNPDGEPDALEYDRLVVPLAAVVQGQMAEIATLTDRIAALETALTELQGA